VILDKLITETACFLSVNETYETTSKHSSIFPSH
jgi:hypothetical protein